MSTDSVSTARPMDLDLHSPPRRLIELRMEHGDLDDLSIASSKRTGRSDFESRLHDSLLAGYDQALVTDEGPSGRRSHLWELWLRR